MQDVEIGDIVLLHQSDGTVTPSIVVNALSPTEVQLYNFSIGGSGGSSQIYQQGSQPGQWEPKPKH